MEGILKVIDMLGLTIANLQAQLEQERQKYQQLSETHAALLARPQTPAEVQPNDHNE